MKTDILIWPVQFKYLAYIPHAKALLHTRGNTITAINKNINKNYSDELEFQAASDHIRAAMTEERERGV